MAAQYVDLLMENVDGNLSTLELKWKTTHRDLRFSIIMLYHFFHDQNIYINYTIIIVLMFSP